MFEKGDKCSVIRNSIHFFEVGTLVEVLGTGTAKLDGEEVPVVDVVSLNGELPGLFQGVLPEDLEKLS